jgi:uncharacterized protein (DUF305 family)
MTWKHAVGIAGNAAVLVLAGACAGARQPTPSTDSVARVRADSVRNPYTAADIQFMTGMIHHHGQAIAMSKLAPANGATASVRTLAARIINAQTDEISLIQQWLRERRQPAPEPSPAGMRMVVGGVEHDMLMPGMLTDAQMKELESAKGGDFDQRFLELMIYHHRGAVAMVKELLDSRGAALDETVFKLAADISADQQTEIGRMQQMLIVRD